MIKIIDQKKLQFKKPKLKFNLMMGLLLSLVEVQQEGGKKTPIN